MPVNASREIVDAVAAAHNLLPNVGVQLALGGLAQPLQATKSGHEGWTTDVAIGLRYTELLHATHNFCSVPMFDKGLAVPLFVRSWMDAGWSSSGLLASVDTVHCETEMRPECNLSAAAR